MTNNREIKFRGFHRDENGKEKIFVNSEWVKGYWVYGVPVFEEDRCYIIQNLFICSHCYLCTCTKAQVIPETVGQYTGLKDKDGKEIFEGDIVQSVGIPLSDCKSIVRYGIHKSDDMSNKYQCGNLGFYLEHILRSYKMGRKDIMFFIVNCEVIGNIYENPELLEVK